MFAKFSEKAQACDGRPCEDDRVPARDVLAELLSHQAVELRFVLQGGETVCALAVLQMDRNLQSGRKQRRHLEKWDVDPENFDLSLESENSAAFVEV